MIKDQIFWWSKVRLAGAKDDQRLDLGWLGAEAGRRRWRPSVVLILCNKPGDIDNYDNDDDHIDGNDDGNEDENEEEKNKNAKKNI